jgi:hypothetical protein
MNTYFSTVSFHESVTRLTLFSLDYYKDMAMHKITDLYKVWFSVCPNTFSKCRTIAIFKSVVKQRMIQVKLVCISMIFYNTELQLSECNGS